jgi:hypothetical protein
MSNLDILATALVAGVTIHVLDKSTEPLREKKKDKKETKHRESLFRI